jgi:hypothetical protein
MGIAEITMKKLICVVMFLLISTALVLGIEMSSLSAASVFPSTTFYVVPHADDWQLFMGRNSWNDVRAREISNLDNKVVFIHITAGDAGLATGSNGQQKPFYLARENGANRAIRFLANIGETGGRPVTRRIVRNGKVLERIVYKNTVTYYFRLPDGDFTGNGFPETGNASLQRFYNNQISKITSITGNLTFNDWNDLVKTLHDIVKFEARGATSVWLNIQDPNSTINVGDHSDHTYTALAMQDAVATIPCVNQSLFRTYGIADDPVNLSQEDQWKHSALWGVTTSGIADFFHPSTWDLNHNRWLGRLYNRVILGNGACTL